MARPTKYTPETVQKLTQAIELGATYELACNYAGIEYSTFSKWKLNKPELVDAVRLAEGKAAVKWLAKIEAAAADHWQAAAWKLERRYPQDYGRTVQEQQHTGKDGTPFEIVIRRDND
jgi:hypothetical protein